MADILIMKRGIAPRGGQYYLARVATFITRWPCVRSYCTTVTDAGNRSVTVLRLGDRDSRR